MILYIASTYFDSYSPTDLVAVCDDLEIAKQRCRDQIDWYTQNTENPTVWESSNDDGTLHKLNIDGYEFHIVKVELNKLVNG